MKKLIGLLVGLAAATAVAAHDPHDREVPRYQKATSLPDRIIATLNGDATSGFSVTWRTDETVTNPIAQIVEASADARFDLGAKTVLAITEALDPTIQQTPDGPMKVLHNSGLPLVHYHSYKFKGLKPDTLYAYRVRGARGLWSEWFQIRTAPESGPVSFVYFGDAQNAIRSHWSRVIRAASIAAPDATFYLHTGDLVSRGFIDFNWAEWFAAGSFLHAMKPAIPVVGNHEYIKLGDEGGFEDNPRVLGNLWRPQFSLPTYDDLPEELAETVYEIRVNKDLHIFAMDSASELLPEQIGWIEKKIEASDAKWKILTMHHPMYTTSPGIYGKAKLRRQELFWPLLRRQDIDMVLVGHHHSYSRAVAGKDVAKVTVGDPRDVDVIFVVSSSGAKMGDYEAGAYEKSTAEFGDDMKLVRFAANSPMFQVISVEGDKLEFRAHLATGELYDAFTVNKDAEGKKALVDGVIVNGEPRTFENTGPYRPWSDIR